MEEIKAFVEKLEGMSKDEIINGLPGILDKAKNIGFVKVAKELPDLSTVIRDKVAEFDVDEAITLIKQFMPVVFEGMKELAESNEDVAEELEDIDDTTVSLVIEDADFAITLIVKDGKFDYKLEQVPDADLVLKMNKTVMKDMMSGESDAMQAYMSGDVKAEGNLTKAMALRSIFEAMSEEFGFELMG
ncbi:MAG: SCP2 sterol-binding domain-containing protein [Candidatus Helarchaeota archaeon]